MYFSNVSVLRFLLEIADRLTGYTIRVYTVSGCSDARLGTGHISYSLCCAFLPVIEIRFCSFLFCSD